MTSQRDQPWSDRAVSAGRVLVLSANPVSQALTEIASVAGWQVTLREVDDDGRSAEWLDGQAPGQQDAVVVCDHDAPDAAAVLRAALTGSAGYVAMLASRGRSVALVEELLAEGFEEALERLHVPAGLNIGGKSPGEIALSVAAEIVAWSNGRDGGPMRNYG